MICWIGFDTLRFLKSSAESPALRGHIYNVVKFLLKAPEADIASSCSNENIREAFKFLHVNVQAH